MTSTRNPSFFIKEQLLQKDSTAYNLWKAYKQSSDSSITFQSFLKYVGMLKRLELIEATGSITSKVGKGNMFAPAKKATILRIKVTDSDSWVNPFKALYPEIYEKRQKRYA